MNAPETAPPAAVQETDPAVLHVIEKADYVAMLRSCLPTLNAEHKAAMFMLAELTRQGDVQIKKAQFMKAAGKVVGGLPPMTDAALRVIAAQKQK